MSAQIQEDNEYNFSQKHLNTYVKNAIKEDPYISAQIQEGVERLTLWLAGDYYASKKARLAQLDPLSIPEIVMDVFVTTAYCLAPELYISLTAKLATKMGFDNHRDSIVTIAEIVAVLCETDAFDIIKADAKSSLMVVSRMSLPKELINKIENTHYMPPMVCQPNQVYSNYESGYLTYNDSLILGPNNGHNEDICLDVINLQNRVKLQLCKSFLNDVPEEPTYDIDTPDKVKEWAIFRNQSEALYEMLQAQSEEFYLTNKVDKRGRMYAQGYHVTTQGSPFKKAMIELAHKEFIEGVPV